MEDTNGKPVIHQSTQTDLTSQDIDKLIEKANQNEFSESSSKSSNCFWIDEK